MANASHKSMGNNTRQGHQTAGEAPIDTLDEHVLADEIAGKNSLQGVDQSRRHNQRESMPGEQLELPADEPPQR